MEVTQTPHSGASGWRCEGGGAPGADCPQRGRRRRQPHLWGCAVLAHHLPGAAGQVPPEGVSPSGLGRRGVVFPDGEAWATRAWVPCRAGHCSDLAAVRLWFPLCRAG